MLKVGRIGLTRRGKRAAVYVFLLGLVLIWCLISGLRQASGAHGRPLLLDSGDTKKVVTELRFRSQYALLGKFPSPKLYTDSAGWTRVPKDLLMGRSWTKRVFLEYRTEDAAKAEQAHLACINEIHVASHEDDTGTIAGYRYEGYGVYTQLGQYDKDDSVTMLNVLYGRMAVDPRPGWHLSKMPIRLWLRDWKTTGRVVRKDSTDLDLERGRDPHYYDSEVYLSVKRGSSLHKPVAPLKFQSDGKFKILQVADAHFVAGYGTCRDPWPDQKTKGPEACLADHQTLNFINRALDLEKPQLVVMTGDQVFGSAAKDFETAIFKLVAPLIKRGIPYAMVMGNHDSEGDLSRRQIFALLDTLPFSLSKAGPNAVSGWGNYDLAVESKDSTTRKDLIMYLLDSHSYTHSKVPGYDYIKPDQKELVQLQYEEETRASAGGIGMSMAFFHIPLPEYRDLKKPDGQPRVMTGSYKEGCTAPMHNSGMFEQFRSMGVQVCSVGHDHCNDYCLENHGTWLCYGGAVGEGGYGGYGGTERRLRVFEVDDNEYTIRSWKRMATKPDERFDDQWIYKGVPPAPKAELQHEETEEEAEARVLAKVKAEAKNVGNGGSDKPGDVQHVNGGKLEKAE